MAFVNRKQFYSINVRAVCDSHAFITNIVARWPGSTHDSRIFENSKIADKLREGALDGILVGDSGYACRAYLITSILKTKNAKKSALQYCIEIPISLSQRVFIILTLCPWEVT